MDYANAAAGDVMMEFNTNGLQTGAEMNSARARVGRMAAADPAAPNKARASGVQSRIDRRDTQTPGLRHFAQWK